MMMNQYQHPLKLDQLSHTNDLSSESSSYNKNKHIMETQKNYDNDNHSSQSDNVHDDSDNHNHVTIPTTMFSLIPPILSIPNPQNYSKKSSLVHCVLIRHIDDSPSIFSIRYSFMFQRRSVIPTKTTCSDNIHPANSRTSSCSQNDDDDDVLLMIAEKKQNGNRKSKYHIYDMTRLGITSVESSKSVKLVKKGGNYLGKLRLESNAKRGTYCLYDSKADKDQIAAFVYDIPSIANQIKNGQPPRRFQVAIPSVGDDGKVERRASYMKNKLVENIRKNISNGGTHLFHSREPSFEGGQYRLNFGGRVTIPSVKNMQIMNSKEELIVQFGKVDENIFHLDYKEPFNAFQAFSLALTSLDL